MLKKIKKFIKGSIRKCDLFSQQVTFRYNDQPAYETVTGGCISILLIIAFIGIFATTLLKTVDKEYINFNESRDAQQSPSYFATTLQKNFLFAIGLDGIDLNSGERYFDIFLQFRYYHDGIKEKIPMTLVPCPRTQWEERGYGSTYDKLSFNKWLCPLDGTQIQLQGKFSSQSFKFYKISAKKCNPSLDALRPCVADSVIDSYLDDNEAFNFNFYFINTIINPGDQKYLSTYLQDVNYFPFSNTNGVNANLYISSFKITTDESLYPVEDPQQDQGGIVLNSAQVMNYQVRGKEYMKLFLRKSPISLKIQRSFRKIDDTLSYIGGLFSTIVVFFGFISLYNQLSYEISISKQAYYYDKNDPFDGDHFNLISYAGYMVFSFFDKFGIQLPWKRFQRMHRFLQEGRKHLDIRLIMQKILYAEKLGLAILDKNKHKALLLSEPFTLQQADEIRKDLKFYKHFRKKFFSKGESVEQNEEILTYNHNANSKTQIETSLQMTIPNQIRVIKSKSIIPNGDQTAIIEHTSSEILDFNNNSGNKSKEKDSKKTQPQKIKNDEQFYELDSQIKECLKELENEIIADNDFLANKIMEKIDPRIKRRYLGESGKINNKQDKDVLKINGSRKSLLAPLKMAVKRKSQENVSMVIEKDSNS